MKIQIRQIVPLLLLAATTADAHPGHLAEVAGHGHWIGAAAIGLAVLVGIWGKLKDREAADSGDEPEETGDEAEA
ncbi:DUF6732 family protein [Roseisalinus antarcticus]|uniref:HupE / UreJ protein n=1 Tax=Roseisalinus antarcticus TaxID=254357 RepID=A0A1Y5SNB1_9RHOB|nr:DUF6732 family protein [Roseisalinus antarcticus]SLN44608.1 hypothetical protein ROA7023_01835 [Roseisalinus antarcticus]